MKKFEKFGKKPFVFKSWQNLLVCLATSSVATLLISFQFQSKALSSSSPNNITNVKSEFKVTRKNSSCAKAFINTLLKYNTIHATSIVATWRDSRGNIYHYSEQARTKSNNKSLQNDEQSAKQKFFPSSNLLIAYNHDDIERNVIRDERNTVHNDGASLISMLIQGFYSDGSPCEISFNENTECGYGSCHN